MEYTVQEYSKFKKSYKKARKKYKRSFDDDFATVMKVIRNKIADGLYDQNPRKLPKTVVISGLGAGVEHEICKTRMMIEAAQDKIGRLIWLHDRVNHCIFLIEVYHKNQRSNHNVERIRRAYKEYRDEYLN